MFPNHRPLLLAAALIALNMPVCAHAEKADRDQPINLEADSLKLDDLNQVNTFDGHVQLIQGTILIKSDKIVVTKSHDGYQHMVATGMPSSFRQRMENSPEFVEGYGERIEYDTRADTVDFFSHARVKRGQDEVQGDHITYNSKTEIFEAHSKTSTDGKSGATKERVRAVIQPKQNKTGTGDTTSPPAPASASTSK
jgi:lipopolysaccharide export system protein LptA